MRSAFGRPANRVQDTHAAHTQRGVLTRANARATRARLRLSERRSEVAASRGYGWSGHNHPPAVGPPNAHCRRAAAWALAGGSHEQRNPVAFDCSTAPQNGSRCHAANAGLCFRLHKRGSHWLQSDTRTIERDIGGAIADAFATATAGQLRVNLEDPDVKIVAEVLGPLTCIGVDRRDWRPVPLLAPARPIVADAAEVGASAGDRV